VPSISYQILTSPFDDWFYVGLEECTSLFVLIAALHF
jgi:hypothetical protein